MPSKYQETTQKTPAKYPEELTIDEYSQLVRSKFGERFGENPLFN